MVITCSTHFQSQKTLCIIMPAEYLCCQYINSLHCATWLAGSRGGRTGPVSPVLARPLFWHPSPTTHEHHKGSFVYQSEIAASGMWCTKQAFSQLTCPFHVESETVMETTKKWQWSYKSPSRQLKMTVKKISTFCVLLISTTHLYALPVPLQKTSCYSWAASNAFSMIASKVREGFPDSRVNSDMD